MFELKKRNKTWEKILWFFGKPVEAKVCRCSKCNEVLENIENFCPMCGEKYIDTNNIEVFPIGNNKPSNEGSYVLKSGSLRFFKGTEEDEKEAVKKLKKEVIVMVFSFMTNKRD